MTAWLEALRQACEQTSQNAVAKKLGVSSTMVSRVLARTYAADTSNLEARVRGAYLDEVVECPIMGSLPRNICQGFQQRKKPVNSEFHARLHEKCRSGCKFFSGHGRAA